MPDTGSPTLSTEQVAQLLRLLRSVDAVELKLSVADADRRSAVAALGMDPLDAQIRQVVFLDTPDLTLDQHGVVVRVRRIQRKPGDSIVKLRPLVTDELPPALRKSRMASMQVSWTRSDAATFWASSGERSCRARSQSESRNCSRSWPSASRSPARAWSRRAGMGEGRGKGGQGTEDSGTAGQRDRGTEGRGTLIFTDQR